jgi:hypothetical protein
MMPGGLVRSPLPAMPGCAILVPRFAREINGWPMDMAGGPKLRRCKQAGGC